MGTPAAAMGHQNRLLLLIGSGPGLGRAVASCFAQRYFDRIALIARNAEQLQRDAIAVEEAAASANRTVVVQTWQVDVCDIERLEEALKDINQFGDLECVYYNAARVGPSLLFTAKTETIDADWRVCLTDKLIDAADSVHSGNQPRLVCNSTVGNAHPTRQVPGTVRLEAFVPGNQQRPTRRPDPRALLPVHGQSRAGQHGQVAAEDLYPPWDTHWSSRGRRCYV